MVNTTICDRPEAAGKGPRRSLRRSSAALVASAALALVALPGTAVATHLSCGDPVSGRVTLDNDLVGCPGDGLIVSGAGTAVDLNGHVVSGSGAGAGIRVVGKSGVTIKNGAIKGFEFGVFLDGGHDNRVGDAGGATQLELSGNAVGIELLGEQRSQVASTWVHDNSATGIAIAPSEETVLDPVENELVGNRIENNAVNGIVVYWGAGSKLKANDVVGNGRAGDFAGISLRHSPSSELRGNEINGSSGDGIALYESEQSLLFQNTAAGNGGDGIDVEKSSSLTAVENLAESNAGDGVRLVETDKAKLYDNELRGNGQSGVHLLDSSWNHLFQNTARGNLTGFDLDGTLGVDRRDQVVSTTRHNVLNRNTAEGNEAFGIRVNRSERIVVGSNDVHGNRLAGIYLGHGSNQVTVVNNEVFENSPGIGVGFGPNARVIGNHVHHNKSGISFYANGGYSTLEHRFEVRSNQVEDNEGDGIRVMAGTRGSRPGSHPLARHDIRDNRADRNGDDGIEVKEHFAGVDGNSANGNGDLGIEAEEGVNGRGNVAIGNGNPAQCTPSYFCS